MAWREITDADVEGVLAGPELEAYRQRAGDSDGNDDDKLDLLIASVTDECRAYIEDCNENRLGAANTLPERCIGPALAVLRYKLMTRLGMGVNESRTQEYRDARKFFESVAACKLKIEQPDSGDVVSEANVPDLEVIDEAPQQMTRNQLGGLF